MSLNWEFFYFCLIKIQLDWHAEKTRQWVVDESVTSCPKCQIEFSMLRRRHHCRQCGGIFCWQPRVQKIIFFLGSKINKKVFFFLYLNFKIRTLNSVQTSQKFFQAQVNLSASANLVPYQPNSKISEFRTFCLSKNFGVNFKISKKGYLIIWILNFRCSRLPCYNSAFENSYFKNFFNSPVSSE